MRLVRFEIRNHSRLQDLELEVRQHLVLVGPNDVGKSSALRCLDLLLGASNAQLYSRITVDDLRDPDQAFVVEARFTEFNADLQALFPDEITVNPTGQRSLRVRLEATFDNNQTLSVQRYCPAGGTGRQLSRDQLLGIGWTLLGASDGSRELRDDKRSLLDQILQTVDLGEEKATFDQLTQTAAQTLHDSAVLDGIRSQLAGQLSKALPEAVEKDHLRFVPGSSAEDDALSGVRLHLLRSGSSKSISAQSAGIRALYAIALYDLVANRANVVGIDEPEIHLHPNSQRSLARLLRTGRNQKFLATHSSDIVSAFSVEDIVAVRSGGTVVQPKVGFLSDDQRAVVRWWVRDRLEPLTARRVVAVEGIADRIIFERAAEVTGREVDRLGISIVEADGAGEMGAIWRLFGPDGFDIPISLLIDRDAVAATVKKLSIPEAQLSDHSIWVSERDLEEEYVRALGPEVVWRALVKSGHFSTGELGNCHTTGPSETRSTDDVAAFCRQKSTYKTRAAMVVAELLDGATARRISSVENVLAEISS